jgi:hypothetical protein
VKSHLKPIQLSVRDNDHCKRLADPLNPATFHMEALLPFTEAVKLERGNANVRPPSETKKPFKDMLDTVAEDPEKFHLKNRGITYLCDRFEFDNAARRLIVHVPNLPESRYQDEGVAKFGIADGGHTFSVIQKVTGTLSDFSQKQGWLEPFVRVHFLSGEGSQDATEGIVEALNTSSQVQQFTLDEYRHEFDELKDALVKSGFDVNLISFRENEDKEWHIVEIIQRMSCFLKERWQETHPASMYKSKGKALELFTNTATRPEFYRLFDVIYDVVTLPEYIQSQLSQGELIDKRSLGQLRSVRPLKKAEVRPGTNFPTKHRIDLAAILPMAAAFRELLQLKGGRYLWRVPMRETFSRCVENLYRALVMKSRQIRSTSQLGSDMEYWGTCAQALMRTQTAMIEEKLARVSS